MPNPDDIVIDMKTGRVEINGPLIRQDKAKWDQLRAQKAENKKLIAELEQQLRDDPNHEYAKFIRDGLEHQRGLLKMFEAVIKD